MAINEFLKDLMIREIVPATGCTELGSVALASGWAIQSLGDPLDKVEEITLEVDDRTFKNAFGVGIPATNETGLEFAAAMGASSAQNVAQGLQILRNPEAETIKKARALVENNKIRIIRIPNSKEILIRAKVRSHQNTASAVIRESHDHVVAVERNGTAYSGAPTSGEGLRKLTEEVKRLRFSDLIEFVKSMEVADFPILEQAMEMNVHFAEEAQKRLSSLKIGRVVGKDLRQKTVHGGLPAKVQHRTAIAVEARMKGLDLPVMACAGSGNQGLVATIPVVEVAKVSNAPEEFLLKALALSYLTTIYIKAYTGVLSPICGCGLAAAVGAGCGIVFLIGGGTSQIEAQINNMVGTMAGIICDGGKSGCALKALMAVGLAIESAYLSMEDVRIPSVEGIVGKTVEDTLRNLQQIVESGMSSVDTIIVEIMNTKDAGQ